MEQRKTCRTLYVQQGVFEVGRDLIQYSDLKLRQWNKIQVDLAKNKEKSKYFLLVREQNDAHIDRIEI